VRLTIQHPSWCDRDRCTVTDHTRSGFHRSRPASLDPDPRTDVGVTVQLGRGTLVPGYPDSGTILVDVTVYLPAFDPTDTDERHTLILSGERAVALGRMLVSAGREAAR
jgi:hypothetical protein